MGDNPKSTGNRQRPRKGNAHAGQGHQFLHHISVFLALRSRERNLSGNRCPRRAAGLRLVPPSAASVLRLEPVNESVVRRSCENSHEAVTGWHGPFAPCRRPIGTGTCNPPTYNRWPLGHRLYVIGSYWGGN